MGNVASVGKTLIKLGYTPIITNNFNEIRKSDFIILPGVGSFCAAMENLNKLGLVALLTDEVIRKKKPFLGICLGMQLLAEFGNEPIRCKGLGWIKGEIIKIQEDPNIRIPHLGWNNVESIKKNSFFEEFDGEDFYFIHSYHFSTKENNDIVLSVNYNSPIVAGINKENIFGMQFHPEKSQNSGLRLLKKIIDYNVEV